MNEQKWEEILNTLVENKYTYHEIEKGAGIANGTFGKLKCGALKRLSESNYEKLKKFFIGTHLGIKSASLEEIPEVAALKTENTELHRQLQESLLLYNNQTETIMKLQAEIAQLRPLADNWVTRLNQQKEAATASYKSTTTFTPLEFSKEAHEEAKHKALDQLDSAEIQAQIVMLERELKNEPKTPLIGIKNWRRIRQDRINELKKQLQ